MAVGLAAAIVSTQIGVGYWVVRAIETAVPTDYATSRDLEHLDDIEGALEKVIANTANLQDSMDELAPHAALKRFQERLKSQQFRRATPQGKDQSNANDGNH